MEFSSPLRFCKSHSNRKDVFMTNDEEEDAICGKLIKIGRGRGRMVTAPVLGGSATSLQVRKYQQDPSGIEARQKVVFLPNRQQQFLKEGGTTKCKQPKPKRQGSLRNSQSACRANLERWLAQTTMIDQFCSFCWDTMGGIDGARVWNDF